MRVLIACECSGRVRESFRRLGHDAWSCDLEPTEIPGHHIQGDVREILGLNFPWDLIIAHPDCTYICNSGVRWLDRDIDRWKKMWEACEFFRLFLDHPCPRIAIENPIPHKYSVRWIGPRYSQLVQPYQFGDPYTKATCLWLKGLPRLTGTKLIPREERIAECHLASPGPNRAKDRSRTYPGLAAAMASQWGGDN